LLSMLLLHSDKKKKIAKLSEFTTKLLESLNNLDNWVVYTDLTRCIVNKKGTIKLYCYCDVKILDNLSQDIRIDIEKHEKLLIRAKVLKVFDTLNTKNDSILKTDTLNKI